MKAKLEKGQYCEFDIARDDDGNMIKYKTGYIKAIDGNDYIIDQVSEYYNGEIFECNREVVRNWAYDIPRRSMCVYNSDGKDIYKAQCDSIKWEA